MSDKVKFHSMTKPLKFRTAKLFLLNLKTSFEEVVKGIKSVIYNILYKLNLVDKYSFNDLIRNEVHFPISDSNFTSSFIQSDIEFKLFHDEYVDEEYYHVKGNRLKKLFVLSSTHNHYLVLMSHLTNISIKFPGKEHFMTVQNGLPVLKISINPQPIRPVPVDLSLKLTEEPVDYKTYEVDMNTFYSLSNVETIPADSFWESELEERYAGWISYVRTKMTMDYINYFKNDVITNYIREVK